MNKWLKLIGITTESIAIGLLITCTTITLIGLIMSVGITMALIGIDIDSMPFVAIPASMIILHKVFIVAIVFFFLRWRYPND